MTAPAGGAREPGTAVEALAWAMDKDEPMDVTERIASDVLGQLEVAGWELRRSMRTGGAMHVGWHPEGETGCAYVKVCGRDRAMHDDRYGCGHPFVPEAAARAGLTVERVRQALQRWSDSGAWYVYADGDEVDILAALAAPGEAA